ncbi:hypothetical protein [Cohnella phaseoli]|uniref:hypothetical protein n=1 Tax=Cohnella phaseoli TaxID=456490 RepID=UPI0015F2740F|nr:hypothetical protein [Cohnella phaseoli]
MSNEFYPTSAIPLAMFAARWDRAFLLLLGASGFASRYRSEYGNFLDTCGNVSLE